MSEKPSRARPMSVEDRRESILDAALPLLRDRGADVTTRDIAHAAGIAEGTVFRAFTDKQELISAAIERVMNPEPTYRMLRDMDAGRSLEEDVASIVAILRERFVEIVGLMAVLGGPDGPQRDQRDAPSRTKDSAATVVASILERHSERMRLQPASAAHVLRVLAFGSALPMFDVNTEFTTDEIVDFVLRGIVKEGP